MEALSLNLSDLIEKLSECGNEKEMILKFTAIGRDPELTIQQYPQIFDPSDEEDPTETVSLKDFCGRKGEQVEKIVIAYGCAILRSNFLKKKIHTDSLSI